MIMPASSTLLVVGEVYVDFTFTPSGSESKLRLGGVVHAGRGLWASGIAYSVAAVCPKYLVDQAKHYLEKHGCANFIWLGEVIGAPNVVVIADATEVANQGYEDLLRDEREVTLLDPGDALKPYPNVLIFPGRFDLANLRNAFSETASFSFDIAYDIAELTDLHPYAGSIHALITSTSSELFERLGSSDIQLLISALKGLNPRVFLLKENRGGSRLFELATGRVREIPALLGQTVNSVGVGDVYSATFVAFLDKGDCEAAWRGARAATYYAQTTYPDDFQRDVQRDLKLSVSALAALGGTTLPWHERQSLSIYLAGPDFTYVHKPELDRAVASLTYHNFRVRRPVLENGELSPERSAQVLQETYAKDLNLLKECAAVFAVPLGRDPGTLVEIGVAQALSMPVIIFDPRRENANTMLMGSGGVYAHDLDSCLNGLFDALSQARGSTH